MIILGIKNSPALGVLYLITSIGGFRLPTPLQGKTVNLHYYVINLGIANIIKKTEVGKRLLKRI